MVFKKIIFQKRYVELETPSPFMEESILNFHFDYLNPSLSLKARGRSDKARHRSDLGRIKNWTWADLWTRGIPCRGFKRKKWYLNSFLDVDCQWCVLYFVSSDFSIKKASNSLTRMKFTAREPPVPQKTLKIARMVNKAITCVCFLGFWAHLEEEDSALSADISNPAKKGYFITFMNNFFGKSKHLKGRLGPLVRHVTFFGSKEFRWASV